jgi:hypothetical protein
LDKYKLIRKNFGKPMYNPNLRKNKRILILLLITSTMSFYTFNQLLWHSNSSIPSTKSYSDSQLLDGLNSAAFSSNFSSTGKDLSIALHQSYINNSFNTIVNTSKVNNNNFTLPSPTDTTFNSSYSRFEINDITAPNRTLTFETGTANDDPIPNDVSFSFVVPGNCTLTNMSICFSETDSVNHVAPFLGVYLYRAIWDISAQKMRHNTVIATIDGNFQIEDDVTAKWYNFSNIDETLDITDTNNNTFFIYITQNTPAGQALVEFHNENDGAVDNSIVWWNFFSWSVQNKDPSMTIDLSPLNNTPRPEQVNLEINDINIKKYNDIDNSGFWESYEINSSASGKLKYNVSADWWDVECNISQVQINYTKMDLTAVSTFNIPGSGQSINWNSTLGAINDFDILFSDYRINYTIPAAWENFTASDGTVDKTSFITLGSISSNYRDLQISNAGNGINWYLTAQSENLLTNVHTYVNAVELSTVNFTDNVNFLGNFSETISDGAINLSVYSPDPDYYLRNNYFNDSLDPNIEFLLGSWTISENATEYGQFKIQVIWHNDTAGGLFEKNLTIMAVTDLTLVSPPLDQDRFVDDIFNITVYYNDTGKNLGDQGIVGANIAVNDTYIDIVDEGDGNYNIKVNSSDYGYGWNYLKIDADESYYNLDSIIFSFHLRMKTNITPTDTKDFGNIIRGAIVLYEFNYSDVSGTPIAGATPDIVQLDPSFSPGSSITENGGEPGNYTVQLDTSNVQASGTAYECIFNVTAIGKETKTITIYLTIVLSQTEIKIISHNSSIIKKDGLNQSVFFFFNDTDNDWGIPDLPLSNVTVIDNQTGLPRPIALFSNGTDGYYTLNISVSDLESGWIQLMLNITFEPNYNTSLKPVNFYLRGNLTQTEIISISDIDGEGTLTSIGKEYSCFIGRNLDINFNITDTDNNNALVNGTVNSFLVEFIEIGNSSNQGTLPESLIPTVSSYQGQIDTSNLPVNGTYSITIKVFKTDFELSVLNFNLTLKTRFYINISVVDKPTTITAGESFSIIIKVEYFNGSDWLVVIGANTEITPYFDAMQPGTATGFLPTNDTGEVEFVIFSRSDARNMTLVINVQGAYYHVGDSLEVSDITVNPPSTGLNLEDLIPFLIIIGAAIALVGGSIAVYKGVVVPKKREKSRILKEVKTIFDDAINLEHILLLYKGTGTCIYFKSFGSEEIDPELISGFISAICSFGKDLVCQEELNEINYGDKMLLLSDGEYIRVALVLSKKASIILRKNLMEFISVFEKSYIDALPNWRGQLNIFRNSGILIDEILSTSIILPHEISDEFSNVKALKNPHSKEVLKVANNLMKSSDRKFFFIATLLKEATEKTSKDTAEIFMGIKELRDKKMMIPIEISTIEVQQISQQEMELITQKVASLVNLNQEERRKLVDDLAQIGPAEREAYFVSLGEEEIVSAPIEEKPGSVVIDSIKVAKKEIKNLKKNAKIARKGKDYLQAINIFQNAVKLAINWELIGESDELEELIRLTKIDDLKIKMSTLEKEAKLAAKEEKYNEASQKYKMSSKIASEIFKLGGTEMTKEVKRLSNKSKEYERLI